MSDTTIETLAVLLKSNSDDIKKIEEKIDRNDEKMIIMIDKLSTKQSEHNEDIIKLKLKMEQEQKYGIEMATEIKTIKGKEDENKTKLTTIFAYVGGILGALTIIGLLIGIATKIKII